MGFMARIILIQNGKLQKDIPIIGDSTRIGRERLSHVRIQGPTVSRYHAEIYRRGKNYILEDKNSTNGTRLNGKLVKEKTILKHNDKISIGDVILLFEQGVSEKQSLVSPDNFDGTATVYDLLKHR